MTQADSGRAGLTLTGMASGLLGSSLSVLIVERELVAWLIRHKNPWAQFPGMLSDILFAGGHSPKLTALRLVAGAVGGAVAGARVTTSSRPSSGPPGPRAASWRGPVSAGETRP
jgi:hypothetical protein